jgi:hypothetical protein
MLIYVIFIMANAVIFRNRIDPIATIYDDIELKGQKFLIILEIFRIYLFSRA